ncbi:unnamed protein product [Sphagnum troendelagicum]|uniref:Peptidoglycan binding-like domain-containing protein n=1 Tax=Sphagnum troendelagicum TaxID=128251 RepID=A0ABP0TCA4_9BRYO
MVAKFRAQAAATPIRHYYIASRTERIWWYSSGRENRWQGVGSAGVMMVCLVMLLFGSCTHSGPQGPSHNPKRAFYWFGFLPTQTCLTACFGPETKEALQQFQTMHGVASTGVWGSSSRQALWKYLYTEGHVVSEGGSEVPSNMQPVVSFKDSLSGLKAAGEEQVGICVSELHLMGAKGLLSTISSAPQWKHLPRNASMVALLFAVVVGLLGLGYSVIGLFQGQHGQPVRRRVMRAHWRDDVRGGGPPKTKKQLRMFPGLSHPVCREQEPKYPSHQLHAKSRPSPVDAPGQTYHLIIYDGQVIFGDSPQGDSALRNSPTGLCGSSTSSLQASSKARRPSIPAANAAEQVPKKQASAKSADNHGVALCNLKTKTEGGVGLSQQAGKSITPDNESHDTMRTVLHDVPSALFTPTGLREPLLFEKPVNGQSASKSALHSEAGCIHREGLTRDRLGPSVSGPERKSRVQNGGDQQNKDDVNLIDCVEELRKVVRAAEQNRQAAVHALAEKRQRSLELQVKISRQNEAAVAMEEELVLQLPCYIKIGTEALTKVYKMSLHLSDVSLKQIQET